jgi:hypothetical protein
VQEHQHHLSPPTTSFTITADSWASRSRLRIITDSSYSDTRTSAATQYHTNKSLVQLKTNKRWKHYHLASLRIPYICEISGCHWGEYEDDWRWQPFWDTVQCSLAEVDWHFRGAYCFHHQDDHQIIVLIMEAVRTCKMSVYLTRLHCTTSQKAVISVLAAVRAWNLTWQWLSSVIFSCAVCRKLQMFHRCSLPSSSWWRVPDDGSGKRFWNVCKLLPDYTAQHLRRQPSSRFTLKMTISWDIEPCSLVEAGRNETTRRYIPEGCRLHICRREGLKSHDLHCL